jgi:hypothetical protein
VPIPTNHQIMLRSLLKNEFIFEKSTLS